MPSIGGLLGDTIGRALGQGFAMVMKVLWTAAVELLKGAFEVADWLSVFSVSTTDGPVGAVWPMMLWVSGVIAVGLFFVQLTSAALRGGQGFLRTVSGPVQYGLALGVTATAVATFLTAADGLTHGILEYGLDADNFQDALHGTGLLDVAIDGYKAVQLGLIALFGVLPASLGYLLEMLFRQAAILVLVASVPVVAAGLLSDVTAKWFWRTVRWMLASIAMKPVLALTLTLGVGTYGGADGIKELMIGYGILLISLFAPFTLFRLFAFVDPNTEAGGVFRSFLSGFGVDSYPIPSLLGGGQSGSGGGSDGGSGAIESANTGRFDSFSEHADEMFSSSGVGHSGEPESDEDVQQDTGRQSEQRSSSMGSSPDEDQESPPPPANRGQVVSSNRSGGPRGDGGDGEEPPDPPDSGGGGPRGGGGPKSGGSGGGAASGEAAEVAETAVIV